MKILKGTVLHSILGAEDHSEQYYCNYGVNEEYERKFQAAGLRVSARGMLGETRAVELPECQFFIATLFQPQLSSRPETPHVLFLEFLRAAMRFRSTRSKVRMPRSRHYAKDRKR